MFDTIQLPLTLFVKLLQAYNSDESWHSTVVFRSLKQFFRSFWGSLGRSIANWIWLVFTSEKSVIQSISTEFPKNIMFFHINKHLWQDFFHFYSNWMIFRISEWFFHKNSLNFQQNYQRPLTTQRPNFQKVVQKSFMRGRFR